MFFFFKQKTAYEMRISDWSSDVCSSDLWQIRLLVHPHRMRQPTYNGKPISEDVIRSVMSFFVFYILIFAALSAALAAFGLDFVAAFSGAAQALGNIGPGLDPTSGPAGTYAPLPDGAKWVLSVAMLLGRSEEHTSELQSLLRISYAVF